MPQFPIIPSETALLFFDCLNSDLHPENPTDGAWVEASGIIPTLVKINRSARGVGIPVFYAQGESRADGKDFVPQIVDLGYWGKAGEGPYLTRPSHRPPEVMAIIPEISPQPGDYVIRKPRWNAFYQTHLELSLRTAGVRTIMLAGGSTRVGLASTAYAARDRDFNIIILRDATWGNRSVFLKPEELQRLLLQEVYPVFSRVLTVDEAIALFSEVAKGKQ